MPIKAEYYCAEYKDIIDIRNAALVIALKEARSIKCEVLRQQALRQIRRRKREVPDKPEANDVEERKDWPRYFRPGD